MKLGAAMDCKPEQVVIATVGERSDPSTSKNKYNSKKVVAIVVGVTLGVLALAATIATVCYFTTNANVLLSKRIHMKIKGEKVDEDVVVDKKNQQVEIKTVGADGKIIYDYNRAIVVMVTSNGCGLTPLTRNNSFSMSDAENTEDSRVDKDTPVTDYKFKYVKGETISDRSVVSELAQKECKNKPMHWLAEQDERTTGVDGAKSRERRGFRCYWYRYCFCNKYYCYCRYYLLYCYRAY